MKLTKLTKNRCIRKAIEFVTEEAAGYASGKLWGLFRGAKEAASSTAPRPASTVSHHIKHADLRAALTGLLVGALLTAAAVAAAKVVVAAAAMGSLAAGLSVVATGSLSWGLSLGATAGAILAGGGFFDRAGNWITDTISSMLPADDGPILEGSPNVLINGLRAGRAGLDPVDCTKHGPTQLIAEGSDTVFINNAPAARLDDRVVCGAPIKQGSKTVLLGGGTTPVFEVQHEFSWGEQALLFAVEYLMPLPRWGTIKSLKNLPSALKGISWKALGKKIGTALSSAHKKGTELARAALDAIKGGPHALKEALKGILVGVCGTLEDESRGLSDSDVTKPSDSESQVGCPIDASTGAVVEVRRDFCIGITLPIHFVRTYDSNRHTSGLLGRGWRDSLSEHIEISFDGDRVTFYAADGTVIPFDIPSDLNRVYNRKLSHFTLIRAPRGFTLHDRRDGTTRNFELLGDRGRLTGIHDPHGNGVVLGYVGERLSWVRHSDGQTLGIRVEREPTKGLEVIVVERMDVGAPLLVARYTRKNDLLVEVNVPTRHHLTYEYDRFGRMSRWSDGDKTWTRYEYDDRGRCIRSRAAGGLFSVDLSYDASTRTTLVRNGQGHVSKYQFDEKGQLLRRVDPQGNAVVYKYDRHGERIAYIDPLGRAKQWVYDPLSGVLVRRYDGEGNCTELFYDDDLRVIAIVDALGHTWRCERDSTGVVTRLEVPGGASYDYRYTRQGLLAEVKRSDGSRRAFTYDIRNRLMAETDWAGNPHRYEYDERDRLVAVQDPGGHRESLLYDPRDLLVACRHGEGGEVRLEHDRERLLTVVTDENGFVSRLEYGPFDLLRSATDAEGRRYEVTYNLDHPKPTGLKAPDGRWYRLERDAAGRVVQEIDYGGRVTEYRRDAAGNVIERTNAAGERTSYVYDKTGRLIEIEADGEATTYEYDALGRLIMAENLAARLEWEYDAAGRVIRSIQGGDVLEYRYDTIGRCIERVSKPGSWWKAAHETRYGHDENGRLRRLELAGEELEIERDSRGNVVRVSARDGLRLQQEHDFRGYLLEQRLIAAKSEGAAVDVLRRRCAYDLAHNLVEVQDSHWGVTRYRHDQSSRIVSAVRSGGLDEAFAYDANGLLARWHMRTAEGDHITGIELDECGLPCRFGDDEYEFDGAGRLVAKTVHRRGSRPLTWTFRWNSRNQLVEARTPEGEVWKYVYDPLGRRVIKCNSSSNTRVHFLWDGDVLLRELHLAVNVPEGREQVTQVIHWHYEPGTFRPIARENDDEAQVILSDTVGTPVAVAATDGEVVWRGQRATWGELLRRAQRYEGDDVAMGFPGQYLDVETGLFYNRFRYYATQLGAYVSPDPLGLAGGGQPWAYVHNPNVWLDPLGLIGTGKCGADVVPSSQPPLPLPPGPSTQSPLLLPEPSLPPKVEGLGNIGSHDPMKVDDALSSAEKWLGPNYIEVDSGIYRSLDGKRQFRMTDGDILGTHGTRSPHVYFEAFGADNNKPIESLHIEITE